MEKEDVLFSWCKKNKTNYNELKELISFYSSTEENINKSNENFLRDILIVIGIIWMIF